MQQLFRLQLLVVIKVLRYQVAALVAASIIGGGPWTFNADAATFTVRFPPASPSSFSAGRTP